MDIDYIDIYEFTYGLIKNTFIDQKYSFKRFKVKQKIQKLSIIFHLMTGLLLNTDVFWMNGILASMSIKISKLISS